MSHRNAPLSVEGRHRLVQRCERRPIAHVAAEMGISRACASTWVNRYRRYGATGLHERSSTPYRSPRAASAETVAAIEAWRREHKWSAARITAELAAHGITRIHRVITDNGACYRSAAFSRIVTARTKHRRTRPFKPQHNGKVERYQRIMAEEVLYARPYHSEDERAAALATWNIHYNYHRPHSAAGGRPPATRLHAGVTNVQPSYN